MPASKIELVQKYVGGSEEPARRWRTIGGRMWVRQKEAAEQAVTDLAADMLELQAARALAARHRLSRRHRLAARVRRLVPVSAKRPTS